MHLHVLSLFSSVLNIVELIFKSVSGKDEERQEISKEEKKQSKSSRLRQITSNVFVLDLSEKLFKLLL